MALQVAFVLVLLAWAFALWYSVARPEPEPLDDASRDRIRTACTEALHELRDLAPVEPADGPREIATLVDAEDAVFAAMLDDIAAVTPTDADGAEALRGWHDDWKALLAARTRHADELRATGDRVEFRIPAERGGSKPITVRMDEYARMKGLDACSTATLQAETVDVARRYPRPDE